MRVFIIGFMGAGKTTVGKHLANQANYPFIDLDELIEKNERLSIKEIFNTKGEDEFRNLETSYLQSIKEDNLILSTGGGCPCFNDNLAWMKENGFVIFLNPDHSILINRILKDQTERPLLDGLTKEQLTKKIEEMMTARISFYESAHISLKIKSHDQNPAEELYERFQFMF